MKTHDFPLIDGSDGFDYKLVLKDEDNNIISQEEQRFTKHSALLTLFLLSLGPLSLIFQAIGEMIDMLMITKRFNSEENSYAIQIIGFSNPISQTLGYVGLFFGQALTTRVSFLIGEKKRDLASELISDVFYCALIFSLFFGGGFAFVIKPFLRFVGTPDYMLNSAFKYNIISLAFMPFSSIFTLSIYYLQSIGNSILSGLVKLFGYILLLILSAIFLFGFKVPTIFMKMGSNISMFLGCFVMLYLIFKGKFSLKPNCSYIFEHFCTETPKALLSALPLILAFAAFFIPPTLILQTLTSNDPEHSEQISAAFAIFTQFNTFNQAIPGAFVQGFISAATHAWGSDNPKRVLRLLMWTFVIIFPMLAAVALFVIIGKTEIAKMFLEGELEREFAKKILPAPFYTSVLQGISLLLSMLMVVIGKPIFAFLPQLMQILILSIGCKVMGSYCKDDMTKIMHIYNISDVTIFIVFLALLIIPIRIIRNKIKMGEMVSMDI